MTVGLHAPHADGVHAVMSDRPVRPFPVSQPAAAQTLRLVQPVPMARPADLVAPQPTQAVYRLSDEGRLLMREQIRGTAVRVRSP